MNTNILARSLTIVGALLISQIVVAQAPAGAPAGATGLCKDGTYYTGASKQGACRGHQGVKEWYGESGGSSKGSAAPAKGSTEATSSNASSASTTSKGSTTAQAPAAAPAGATGLCKDGTYYTGASKQGACRGHQGVKEWYGDSSANSKAAAAPSATQPATTPARPTAPATTASASPASAASSRATTTAPAPGGGADKVWLNTASNIYHCPGTKYYGTTKAGSYMTEAEAKAKGARPDHNKPCQ
jgi:hypothetical protein